MEEMLDHMWYGSDLYSTGLVFLKKLPLNSAQSISKSNITPQGLLRFQWGFDQEYLVAVLDAEGSGNWYYCNGTLEITQGRLNVLEVLPDELLEYLEEFDNE